MVEYKTFHDVWSRLTNLNIFNKYLEDRNILEPAEAEEVVITILEVAEENQVVSILEDMASEKRRFAIFGYMMDDMMASDSSLVGIAKGVAASAVLQDYSDYEVGDGRMTVN